MNVPAEEPPTAVPAQQGRRGVTRHNVRYVLGFGTAAAIAVFGIIWLFY
jgi:hypothetical protein